MGGILLHAVILSLAIGFDHWPLAIAWLIGMGVVMPFFGAIRPVLEHRDINAKSQLNYYQVAHGAIHRLFGDGLLARTLGGAGFNRHLLHHSEPQLSYTQLSTLEKFLLQTKAADLISNHQTTYSATFMRLDEDFMKSLPKCLACGETNAAAWALATDAEYFTVNDTFQFYRCASCQVLFIDPVPADLLNTIYPSNYYSLVAPTSSIIFAIKNWLDQRIFKKIFSQLPGKSLNVLDIGGGAGWQLNMLRAIEPRITKTYLVDLDPQAEVLARQNGHEYFCGGIEDYETNIKFDFVLLLNLIEHVKDPAKVLIKLRSMLAPGGIAIVKTPNYDALDARLFRHKNWAGYHCPRHWVLFTKESFEKLVARTGLQVKHFSYTQGAPFWAASFLFWLSKAGLVNISKERPVVYHPLFGVLSAGFALIDFIRRPFAKTSQMFFMLGVESQ